MPLKPMACRRETLSSAQAVSFCAYLSEIKGKMRGRDRRSPIPGSDPPCVTLKYGAYCSVPPKFKLSPQSVLLVAAWQTVFSRPPTPSSAVATVGVLERRVPVKGPWHSVLALAPVVHVVHGKRKEAFAVVFKPPSAIGVRNRRHKASRDQRRRTNNSGGTRKHPGLDLQVFCD